MPNPTGLPKIKSPPGFKVDPDGSQQEVVVEPDTIKVAFPNLETAEWSRRPAGLDGWYRDVRRIAAVNGGRFLNDDRTASYLQVEFKTESAARRFAHKLVQEKQMNPRNVTATRTTVKQAAAMTKQHFIAVADALSKIPDQAQRGAAAEALAGVFARANPRFDKQRFMDACNGVASSGPAKSKTVAEKRAFRAGFEAGAQHGVKVASVARKTAAASPPVAVAVPKASARKTATRTIDLVNYVRTASGQFVFAADEPDELTGDDTEVEIEVEAEPEDDASTGDEVLVMSLDDAMVGKLVDSDDGTQVVEILTDDKLIDEVAPDSKEAVRKIRTATVGLLNLPVAARVRGLEVRLGRTAAKLHRAVDDRFVEIMTLAGPRRVEASKLQTDIKIASLAPMASREPDDFLDTLRAGAIGHRAANQKGSGLPTAR
jgi:hypothetical protein